jgi:hypothetical protein
VYQIDTNHFHYHNNEPKDRLLLLIICTDGEVVLACISIDHGKNEGGVSSVLKS